MGIGFRRTTTAGALTVSLMALAFAAPAYAAEPVVDGSCDATVHGGTERKPLRVDAGALLNQPDVLDVGLGAESDALVALPVKETVDGLGVSEVEPVSEPVAGVCDGAQGMVNTLAAPVQNLVPGREDPAPPPPESGGPGPGDPAPEPGPEPGGPGPDVPILPGGGGGPATPDIDDLLGDLDPLALGSPFEALGPLTVPPAAEIPAAPAPERAPDLGQPDAGEQQRDQPGQAQAVPAANEPDRLPLLLAVIALVLVVAALARTWMRGRPA